MWVCPAKWSKFTLSTKSTTVMINDKTKKQQVCTRIMTLEMMRLMLQNSSNKKMPDLMWKGVDNLETNTKSEKIKSIDKKNMGDSCYNINNLRCNIMQICIKHQKTNDKIANNMQSLFWWWYCWHSSYGSCKTYH